jgi:ABC-type nitrate/sulfonate/bicarbonate transport system substrate-binding protein
MSKFRSNGPIRLGRRDVLMRGGAGVLGTLIAASTFDIAGAQTPSADAVMANLRSIKLGTENPNYATQWTFRLVQALGYLEEVGMDELEVVLSEEYVPGLIGGSLDIAHGDVSTFLSAAVQSGLPVKMISIHRDSEWWIMGVAPGIETVDDLRGKSITGGNLAGRNTYIMREVLKKMGLNPDTDVQMVPSSGGSDSRLGALLAGQVQGASLFPRHEAPLVAAGGKFIFQELQKLPQEGFAVMGDWLEDNADTVRAWLRADLKARQWLHDPANKEQAYQVMVDLGYEIPDSFRALYEVEVSQLSKDAGFESAQSMDDFVAELIQTEDVPAGTQWRDHFDLTYLWEAQDALGIARRPAAI